LKEAVTLFSALSDETRLRILALLTHGELCVCHIEAVLRMPQSRVSRHLTVLRHAGLVSYRREGTWIHYSLPEPKNDLEARLQDCLRTCLQEAPQVQADVRRIAGCPPFATKCCEEDREGSPPARRAARRLRHEAQNRPLSALAGRTRVKGKSIE
jgi:ArsR family transcriptional regulator